VEPYFSNACDLMKTFHRSGNVNMGGGEPGDFHLKVVSKKFINADWVWSKTGVRGLAAQEKLLKGRKKNVAQGEP